MLCEMGKSIDAVTVSTPDHTHAPAALMAMRMGKHCFCQKPLTHTIYEARLMAKVAKEMKLATQMGNQGTASSSLRKAAAIVKSGALGPVKEVHVWTNRPIWPQGGERPKPVPCPAHLKWDLWLSVAPVRPYANGYHTFAWRGWWDFGTGALGDMACHTVNMPYMALNLRDPVAVQAECSGHNKDSYPKWSIIAFDYPAQGKRPPVKLFWYDGGKKPDADLLEGKKMEGSGCLVIGEKGKLYGPGDYCDRGLSLLGGVHMPKVKWTESPGHFEEWVLAIKGGEAARRTSPPTPAACRKPSCWATWRSGPRPPARVKRCNGMPRISRPPTCPNSMPSSSRPTVPAIRWTRDAARAKLRNNQESPRVATRGLFCRVTANRDRGFVAPVEKQEVSDGLLARGGLPIQKGAAKEMNHSGVAIAHQ